MTGEPADMLSRLKALLPAQWFQDATPVLDAVLLGIAKALASVYSLTAYARQQTRIATATDQFLDLISLDYLGATLPRRSGESDTAFRARIKANLLTEKVTRRGIVTALQTLTGRMPTIFEPTRPTDTGAYNTNTLGYNVAGGYGSLMLPAQIFVTAYRPTGQGVPNVAGYGNPQGAYSTGSPIEYASQSLIAGAVTDADIYATIDRVKAAGVTAWVAIKS